MFVVSLVVGVGIEPTRRLLTEFPEPQSSYYPTKGVRAAVASAGKEGAASWAVL